MSEQLDIIRRLRLTPYRAGMGPRFALTVWATRLRDARGQTILGYRLSENGRPLFQGEDFAGSPRHADDSNATMAALLNFLTLRPGDTDADYFGGYTDAQRAFCTFHAEALSCYVSERFGEY